MSKILSQGLSCATKITKLLSISFGLILLTLLQIWEGNDPGDATSHLLTQAMLIRRF